MPKTSGSPSTHRHHCARPGECSTKPSATLTQRSCCSEPTDHKMKPAAEWEKCHELRSTAAVLVIRAIQADAIRHCAARLRTIPEWKHGAANFIEKEADRLEGK